MRATTEKPVTVPVLLYVVWCGERWRKVAQVGTSAEASNISRGSGDYWVAEVRTPALAGALFDEPTRRD